MPVSGLPHLQPLGPLVQDHYMKSLVRDVCVGVPVSEPLRLLRKISVWGTLVQDERVKISSARSCRGTCARSVRANLSRCSRQDLLSKIQQGHFYKTCVCESLVQDVCASRSPQQDPVWPLVKDLCMQLSCAYLCIRISAPRSCMTTCARSLYADFCARSLCQDVCIRILQDRLWNFSVCESLVQDLSVRTFAHPIGLAQDLCMRISRPRSPSQDLVSGFLEGHLCKIIVLDLCSRNL